MCLLRFSKQPYIILKNSIEVVPSNIQTVIDSEDGSTSSKIV